ncbi:MAG: hypothetical protein Q9225_001906 [Loekoesia sp. 1 TL-2023]
MSPSSAAAAASPPLIQLSPSVFVSEPSGSDAAPYTTSHEKDASLARTEKPTPRGPSTQSPILTPRKLIILFTWMSAHPLHISKYVVGYRTRYPDSRILVIRSSPLDVFYTSTSTQRRHLAPALSAALSFRSATSSDTNVSLHIFSNGGSYQARNFLLAYSATTSKPFPLHVTIFDSCPGRATFKRTVLALSSSLPHFWPARLLLLLWIYVLISVYWVVFIPFSIPDPIERVRQALNDPKIMQGETKRCYIYSETDPMVGWDDVEAHSQDASKKGFMVQHEKFEGSGHCAHVRIDGGIRYWAIVGALWNTQGS